MRRYPYKKYLLLVGALFLLLSLPPLFMGSVRGKVFAFFSPAMKLASSHLKNSESERLEVENHLLRIEIAKLRSLLEHSMPDDPLLAKTVAARVIYRDPGSWSSSVWIDVGEWHDPMIQKNSPVVVGRALVGVVDYVGHKQSRVRLISDVGLKPAVRAVRGQAQNMALVEHINPVLRHLSVRKDLPISKDNQMLLGRMLTQFKERLAEDAEGWYLAKGILQGSGAPLWRSVNHTLRGIGFNYDFSDAFGPARELETGKPTDPKSSLPAAPLIKVQDLLVTTGLDGVFPPGLSVAEVTKIFPLKEGAYTYEIEAIPIVENLDSLQTLFVIPPIGYNEEDQPR